MTIPRLNPTPVRTEPLPAARVPTNIPRDAFGVPEALDLSGLGKSVTAIVAEHTRHADNTALLDADNQLATSVADLRTQAEQQHGKNALGALAATQAEWKKRVSEITNNLHTDTQREAFAGRVGARWDSLYSAVEKHTAGEVEQYKIDTADSSLSLAESAAVSGYDTPGVIDAQLGHVHAVVAEMGSQLGWSPETVQSKTLEATSRIHVGVIDSMLSKEQDIGALKYFHAHRSDIVGSALPRVEQAVDVASTRVESQHRADDITSRAVDLGAALKDVRQIQEPSVRDATETRVIHYFENEQRTLTETRAAAYQRAGLALEHTGRVSGINPSDFAALDEPQRIELGNREWQIHNPRADRRVTDDGVYAELNGMSSSSAATRQKFVGLNLSDYRDALSETDYRHFLGVQRSLQNRDLNLADAATRKAAAAAAKKKQRDDDIAAIKRGDLVVNPDGTITRRTVPGGPIESGATPAPATRGYKIQ